MLKNLRIKMINCSLIILSCLSISSCTFDGGGNGKMRSLGSIPNNNIAQLLSGNNSINSSQTRIDILCPNSISNGTGGYTDYSVQNIPLNSAQVIVKRADNQAVTCTVKLRTFVVTPASGGSDITFSPQTPPTSTAISVDPAVSPSSPASLGNFTTTTSGYGVIAILASYTYSTLTTNTFTINFILPPSLITSGISTASLTPASTSLNVNIPVAPVITSPTMVNNSINGTWLLTLSYNSITPAMTASTTLTIGGTNPTSYPTCLMYLKNSTYNTTLLGSDITPLTAAANLTTWASVDSLYTANHATDTANGVFSCNYAPTDQAVNGAGPLGIFASNSGNWGTCVNSVSTNCTEGTNLTGTPKSVSLPYLYDWYIILVNNIDTSVTPNVNTENVFAYTILSVDHTTP